MYNLENCLYKTEVFTNSTQMMVRTEEAGISLLLERGKVLVHFDRVSLSRAKIALSCLIPQRGF